MIRAGFIGVASLQSYRRIRGPRRFHILRQHPKSGSLIRMRPIPRQLLRYLKVVIGHWQLTGNEMFETNDMICDSSVVFDRVKQGVAQDGNGNCKASGKI